MATCPSCGSTTAPDARFCASCGTPLERRCASCRTILPEGARFCPSCGTPTTASTAETPTGTGGEERKVVSVIFADLIGFTAGE